MSKTIAMYIRLSVEDKESKHGSKDLSNSVENQKKLILSYISDNGMNTQNINEYIDDGYTGTNFNRPGFKRLLEDTKQGLIKTILVKDFSRFGRDYLQIGSYLEYIFPMLGVRFISITDGFDSIDSKGATGGMTLGIKNIVNAMYSKDCSDKVKSSLYSRARQGQYVKSFAPYGYIKNPTNKNQLIIDENAAKVVRYIFEEVAKGEKTTEIVRRLNDENVLSVLAYSKEIGVKRYAKYNDEVSLWRNDTIHRIVKNEVYTGKLIYGRVSRKNKYVENEGIKNVVEKQSDDKIIVIPKAHEAIVSEELYKKANEELRKLARRKILKKKSRERKKVINYIHCPYCERMLTLGTSGIYYCRHRNVKNNLDCSKIKIKQSELESVIFQTTRKMLQLALNSVTDSYIKLNRNRTMCNESNLEKDIKIRKNKKIKAYDEYRKGELSKEEYMDKVNVLNDVITELMNRIEVNTEKYEQEEQQLIELQKQQEVYKDVLNIEKYDRQVLGTVIDKVYVYDNDEVEIVWKGNDIFRDLEICKCKILTVD